MPFVNIFPIKCLKTANPSIVSPINKLRYMIIHLKFYYMKITDVKKGNNDNEIVFKNLARTMVHKKQ